jgi:hypothetical protein
MLLESDASPLAKPDKIVKNGLSKNHSGAEVGLGDTCQASSKPIVSFTAWRSFCLHPRYFSVVSIDA